VKKSKSNIIFWGFISLALIGVVSKLITSPSAFLNSILNIIVFTAVIFILYLGITKFLSSRESNKYSSAVKASRKKYKDNNNSLLAKLKNKATKSNESGKRPSIGTVNKKKRDTSHLKLIEGKKNKKKAN
jgi:hypothetical protein